MAEASASLKVRNLKDIHEDDGAEGEAARAGAQPLDALAIRRVLASMGAERFEPRVVAQLQEFVHRKWRLSIFVMGVWAINIVGWGFYMARVCFGRAHRRAGVRYVRREDGEQQVFFPAFFVDTDEFWSLLLDD